MKYTFFLSICLITFINCESEQSSQNQVVKKDEFNKKRQHLVTIDSTFGDLDNDGIEEKVIVLHNQLLDDSTKSEIKIYKQQNQNWKLFYSSNKAILNYIHFYCEGVEIDNGILKIYHNTAGTLKSSQIQKYRYQNNDFELVGFKLHEGKVCQEWITFDCNLSTGKVLYQKEIDNCENAANTYQTIEQETFYYQLDTLPTLSNFDFGKQEMESPKHKALLVF